MRSFLATGGLLLAVLAATDQSEEIRALMKVARDPRAGIEAREAAMEALLELGTEGPRRLAGELAAAAKEVRRRHEEERDRLLAAFASRAEPILGARLDRAGTREMEELRKRILGLTRRRDLTKETVLAESDPALARLEELVVVSVAEVLAADPELSRRRDDLLAGLAAEVRQHAFWLRARDRLAALPDGEPIARRLKEPVDPAPEEANLARSFARIAAATTPMRDADRRIFAENDARAAELPSDEVEGTRLLNLLRVHLGLNALTLDPLLCQASRDHCRDMVELGFFDHDSPVEGKETPAKRAALAGTSANAENCAMGQPSAEAAIRSWWHSPGHQKNLLGPHARTGLGRHQDHWTQMFDG
ncbi:MAG: CAP domain-containing protein [Planctomycetota bacterium]